jgi:hypothetical protein
MGISITELQQAIVKFHSIEISLDSGEKFQLHKDSNAMFVDWNSVLAPKTAPIAAKSPNRIQVTDGKLKYWVDPDRVVYYKTI